MATVAEYVQKQRRKLENLKTFTVPFERVVRTTIADQAVRIFVDGNNSSGSKIGQYDTTKPFYVNPIYSPGRTTKLGRRVDGEYVLVLQGLQPTRGNPSASLIEDPEGEHIFTEKTYFRGGKDAKPGSKHKTTWVHNMKDYRNRIGRRINYVDLTLSGDLRNDFCNAKTTGQAKATKISDTEYQVKLKRKHNVLKVEHFTDKYGKIFDLTKTERKRFFEFLDKEFQLALIK